VDFSICGDGVLGHTPKALLEESVRRFKEGFLLMETGNTSEPSNMFIFFWLMVMLLILTFGLSVRLTKIDWNLFLLGLGLN